MLNSSFSSIQSKACRGSAVLFGILIFALCHLPATAPAAVAVPVDEDAPWPRTRSADGNQVTVHLPQVETWTSNSFRARAAVEVKAASAKNEQFGVIWFTAHGSVDHSNRVVTLDRFELNKGLFPEATDGGSNAMAVIRKLFPGSTRTVSLDYLITALGFAQAAARQGASGFKNDPPEIIWATNRSVLILIDGEPMLRPIPDTKVERVENTPAFLLRDTSNGKFYLSGEGQWFEASAVKGPWQAITTLPAEISALQPTNSPPVRSGSPAPEILVSTRPAELLMTGGLPDFRPVKGTALDYAADTDSQLFFHKGERQAYLLLSGRWFKASSLKGPWTYVPPRELPPDFAKIPPGTPQAIVLASVPGTREADLAVLANSVPTTATVKRADTKLEIAYDGEPRFEPIQGTSLKYAVNAQVPVILAGDNYYALNNGVWFAAAAAQGPWAVATEVPDEIYSIPPSSPVYYATFVRIYQSDENEVDVGYTPGYQGAYEDNGTIVYGTGWSYPPWQGDQYYGWGWTYGYDYVYVPWYQWWVWRPWWNEQGGLRAALIDNVYDRWENRPVATPYVSLANRVVAAQGGPVFPGYPSLYGRHWPTVPSTSYRSPAAARLALATPQALPYETMVLNPYTRPAEPIRSGEIPRGAQLLSSVRQTPSAGRDLYASPDGSIYQRRSNGWYQRQGSGGWTFYAPLQGTFQGDGRLAPTGPRDQAANLAAYRAGAARPGSYVPNSGFEFRAQQVAALERQYYARAMAQYRAQAQRARGGGGNYARPVRAAGGIRRR